MPTSEELEDRAAEADDPRASMRLHQEAQALRAVEFRRAVAELEALVTRADDDELPRLSEPLGLVFGQVLHRLQGAPRLAALEAAIPKED
jgi:hypothetical protein